jgi:peptide subunit release factor RF-3
MKLPELIVFVVIDPKTQADQEKLGRGLQEMMAEDPTLGVNTDTRTGHTIIRGTGELHLEVIVDRLTREFNVAATIGRSHIARPFGPRLSTITRTKSRPVVAVNTRARSSRLSRTRVRRSS